MHMYSQNLYSPNFAQVTTAYSFPSSKHVCQAYSLLSNLLESAEKAIEGRRWPSKSIYAAIPYLRSMKAFPRSGYKEVSGDGYLKRIVLDGADIGVKATLLQEVQFNSGDKVAFHFHKATREIFYCLKGPAPFMINGK